MKEPTWRDLTPPPECDVAIEHYPEPRYCAAGDSTCHLGHPANCRRWVEMFVRKEDPK